MKKIKLLVLFTMLSFLFGTSMVAQVSQTEFQIKYDTTECRWDAYVHIKTGSQGAAAQTRVVIGSQYSIVTKNGLLVDVVANFQPKTNGGNGAPAIWSTSTSKDAPSVTPTKAYHGIVNSISPTTSFASVMQGDSFKLFSFVLRDLATYSIVDYTCGDEVRPFNSTIAPTDPSSTAQGMDGQNYSCGFTFLNPGQTYFGNRATIYPPKPILSAVVACSNKIDINLSVLSSSCQTPLKYNWTGPSYTGTTQDVIVSPASALNNGTYSVTVTDKFTCTSVLSVEANIRANAGTDRTACPGSSITLTGTNPTTGTWSPDPNNAAGTTLVDNGGGLASLDLDPTADGKYLYFYVFNGCPDTIAITVGNPDAGPTPADVSCFSSGSADLKAVGSGSWSVGPSSPGTANFVNPNLATTTVSGFSTSGTYEIVWTSGGCSSSLFINVSDECSCKADDNDIIDPDPSEFCGSSGTILLDGLAAGPSPGTYLWQYKLNSGSYSTAPGTNNQEDYTTQNLSTGAHSFRRIYSFTDGMPCKDTSNVVLLNVTTNITLNANNVVGTSPSSCGVSNGSILISGLGANTDYTLVYSKDGISSSENITASGTGTHQITGLGSGAYTDFSVEIPGGCQSNVFAGPINLLEPGSPSSPTVAANPNPVCLGDVINLTANGQAGATFTWSASSPNAGLGTSTTATNSMTATVAASYTIFVTQTVAGCTSSPGSVSVSVNKTPPDFTIDDVTPIDPVSCGGSDGQITIVGFAPNTLYSLSYTKNSVAATVNITSNDAGSIILIGLSSGSYGNFIVSSGIGCATSEVAGPVILSEPNAPANPVGLTAAPTPACVGETIDLSVTAVSGITFQWTVTPAGHGLVSSTNNTTTMVPTSPGTYTITVKASNNGCESGVETTQVEVVPSPASPTAGSIASSNPTTCGGTDGQITISGYTPSIEYTVKYTFAGSPVVVPITANGSGALVLTGLTAGNYSNISISSENGCSSGVFAGPISLSELGSPGAPENLKAVPNPGCFGETIALTVNNFPGAVYTWAASSAEAGLVTSSTASTSMVATAPGVYTISVYLTVNGCTSPASTINVLVKSICVNPDFGVTFVDVALTGDVSTNDGQTGYDYGNVQAVPGNPAACMPTVNSQGFYNFTCSTLGEFHYTVEVCRTSQRAVCEKMPLVITVLEPMGTNNPPVANHDYSATNGTNDVFINILANDRCQSQPNCSFTGATIITPPANGTWNNSTSVYKANNGFIGRDSFRYEVCQTPSTNPVNCDQEWVYINVYPADASEFTNAMDDYNQTFINTPVSANTSKGVKANDTDPKDLPQTVSAFNKTIAGKGTLVMSAGGDYTFTPATDYVGPVDFAYQVCRTAQPTICDSATLHILIDPQLPLGMIGDFVWVDTNGDGIQSNGEVGIPNVIVKLYSNAGILERSTITNAQGKYLFEDVFQGDYYLEFLAPDKYTPTFANIGDDAKDSDVTGANGYNTTETFTVAGGDVNLTFDAGYYECVKIGELVWYDDNKNDVFDTYENGINSLKVRLYKKVDNNWVLWEQQYTRHKPDTGSDDGWYQFCAPPGTYYVQVVMPPLGLVLVRPFIGNNRSKDSDIDNANGPGTTKSFTVKSGENKQDLGAGYYPMVTMGNLVWMDDNNNGIQEINEARVSGVMVEAYDSQTGEKLGEAMTDVQGTYNIDYLEPREIYLRFETPQGYSATTARVTTDDMDSDVDHSNGFNTTRTFNTHSGDKLVNIDLGLASSILPVTWAGVFAEAQEKSNFIQWRTSSEINVEEYIVERRLETDIDYTTISTAKIKSKNTNDNVYEFTDEDIRYSGNYTYRIKQIDFDGNFDYSTEVVVKRFNDKEINIYPNPTNGIVKISYTVEQGENILVQVYNVDGRLVYNATSKSKSNNTALQEVDMSALESGVYTISLTLGSKTIHQKIVKL